MIWVILLFVVGLIVYGLVYLLWTALCVAVAGILQLAFYYLVIIGGIIVAVYAGTFWLLREFVGEENSGVAALAGVPIGTAVLAILCLAYPKNRGWRVFLAIVVGFAAGVGTLTLAEPNPFGENDTPHSTGAPEAKAPQITEIEARREALRRYPELGVANSKFNSAFVTRYNFYRQQQPDYFKNTSWPLQLAEEIAKAPPSQ